MTILIAHRGDAMQHPENSVAAVRSAVSRGFLHVEIDIQVRDGRMHLTHDEGGEPFEALAEWAQGSPGVRLFLDFKTNGQSALEWQGYLQACRQALPDFVPISHHPEVLLAATALGIAETGYVVFRVPDPETIAYARLLGPEWVFINQIFVPLGGLPAAPWRWVVYEIEDEAQAQRAVKWGAAGLETMRCAEAVQWTL